MWIQVLPWLLRGSRLGSAFFSDRYLVFKTGFGPGTLVVNWRAGPMLRRLKVPVVDDFKGLPPCMLLGTDGREGSEGGDDFATSAGCGASFTFGRMPYVVGSSCL